MKRNKNSVLCLPAIFVIIVEIMPFLQACFPCGRDKSGSENTSTKIKDPLNGTMMYSGGSGSFEAA
ncbi:hypothetical protein [Leucobacter sp. wl10]|uniref:hypothetical protein n=1 Tax=Leucobacter sp. wl10 TaxID=2304677 RepID=UPI0019698B55|nr:hypothetical protein [Leucobacter sp. wl10]